MSKEKDNASEIEHRLGQREISRIYLNQYRLKAKMYEKAAAQALLEIQHDNRALYQLGYRGN